MIMLQKQLSPKVATFGKPKVLVVVLMLVTVLGGCLPTQQLPFAGRVIDESTQTPVEGAKVTLTLQGGPAVGYSDAEGVYRFFVYTAGGQPVAGRLNVEASGYENVDQNVTISVNSANFEEIQLTPLQALSSSSTTEAAASPTAEAESSAITSTLEVTPTLRAEEAMTATVALSPTATVTATGTAIFTLVNTATPRPTNTPTPEPTNTPTAEPRPPFEGIFEGTITGDAASEAPLTLVLTQSGAQVSGSATLGERLLVNVGGGFCGGVQAVPATNIPVTGSTSPTALTHIESRSDLDVGGISVGVDVFADLEEEGELLAVQIALHPPFFCLQPRLLATLRRTG